MPSKHGHISICVCTYKRPKLLLHLLKKLQNQTTDNLFTYSIVAVDNDHTQSAKSTVAFFKENSLIDIDYYNEPEQNISLARNKAVEKSKGNLIAFIDDDEFPVDDWLLNLYKAYHKFEADGVLGPVKPYFRVVPPKWIIKGKLLEREKFKTGTSIDNPKYTRTGNVLISMKTFAQENPVFDPRFGRIGGEDVDLFRRLIEKGHVFVWCNEAPVFEEIGRERMCREYFINRALLRGVVNSSDRGLLSFDTVKSLIAFCIYTSALPALLVVGHHLFMKYLIKDCDHIGKVLARVGIKVVRER